MQVTPNVEKMIHYILVNREFKQIDISREFKIAKGYVSRIITRFNYENFIARAAKNKFVVIEPHKLLLLWATHRQHRFSESKTNFPMNFDEIEEYMQENHPLHAIAMDRAFAKRMKEKVSNRFHVYLPPEEINKIRKEIGWDKYGNTVLFSGSDNELFGREGNLCSIYLNFVDMYSRGFMSCFRLLNKIPTEW